MYASVFNILSTQVLRLLSTLFGLTLSGSASAGELTGFIGLESRYFFQEELFDAQSDTAFSAVSNIEYHRDWDDYRQRFVAKGFARVDSEDSERTHADIRELFWWRDLDSLEIYLGVRQVFWGVTETVHLVNVINQDDLVENIDGEDKLGQPMISALMQKDWGTLELFGLLGFRERTFPGENGRLRSRLVVDKDLATYQSEEEENSLDWAMRWSKVLGDWDVGASHFSGTSRDPLFFPVLDDGEIVVALAPHYITVEQTGVDVQLTKGAWLWKLEAISVKEKKAERNTALVGGFEYSFFDISHSGSDVGILFEYQFDDRRNIRATPNQNDLALGTRWVLNDFQSSELLAALTVDLDLGTRFLSVEASRRLSGNFSVEAELRVFSHVNEADPIYYFRNDDYLEIALQYYF